jgi:hypothetical protein
MKGLFRQLHACAQAMLLACASAGASALPITFSGSFDSFTPGPGYGLDAAGVETWPAGLPSPPLPAAGTPLPGGAGGTLLNVVFTATGTATVTFTLPAAGASVSAVVGTVALGERFIDAAETDGLGLSANFTLSSPVAGPFSVSASGIATVGPVPPIPFAGLPPELVEPGGAVDLTITWLPLLVAFGDGGLFAIDLDTLTFDTLPLPAPVGPGGAFTLEQTATITLLREPRTVPEPAMPMLLALGLAGLALTRARRSA